jgi:5-methylcytosine-specific restriction endonuclease McrA
MNAPRWIRDLEKKEAEVRESRRRQSDLAIAERRFNLRTREAKRLRRLASGHVAKPLVMDNSRHGRRAWEKMGYKQRNAFLRTLGFLCYADYLSSSTWEKIRREVLERSAGICSMCGGCATQVHHRRYTVDNLLGRNFSGLVPMCYSCHHRRHEGMLKRKIRDENVVALDCEIASHLQSISC